MNMTLRNETSVEVLPRKSMTVEENEHLLSDEEEENKKIKMVLFIMISAVLIIISIFGILLSLRRMISSMKIRGGGGQ
jgi:cell division septal protein FtsQ